MKQYVEMFSGTDRDELTSEINTYLEENNCKIVSTQLTMSSGYSYCKTILIVFEEIEAC